MTRRGWCPSVFEPMQAADGYLSRVKPEGGVLDARAAHLLAVAARRYGNGVIELSNRANLQFRGLSEAATRDFADVVVAAGLASADASVERRRNVLVSPLAGVDASVDPGTSALSAAMTAMLAEPALAALPGKFGLVVDGGGLLPVGEALGDIRIRLCGDTALIALDGSDRAAACPIAASVDATRRLILAFLAQSARRMRDLDARAVFAAAGLLANQTLPPVSRATTVGRIGTIAFGFGLPFGQIDSATLVALAALAQSEGDGTLRLTPWRALLLPGVAAGEIAGLITDPADPLLRFDACPGQPSCAQASVATRADAALLARSGIPDHLVVHVSGCAKGCARPEPRAITLVGANGRYDLVRNGRADAKPERLALSIGEITAILAAERQE